MAHSEKGECDLAIADFNKAIELNPEDAEAHSNRGIAYADKGEHDLAIADLDQAERLAREQNLTDLLSLIRAMRSVIKTSRK